MTRVQTAAPAVEYPPANLPETDGEPLESPWHLAAIALLIDLVHCWMQGRTDYFVGGNLFIYYSWQKSKKQDYKGPDFMFVKDVDRTKTRDYWAVWEEEGRYPDVLIELLSSSTARADRTTKKRLYERVFRTPEYFWYDPATGEFQGWRLNGHSEYQAIEPNEHGRLWSEQLGLWLGLWEGSHMGIEASWPRFYDPEGRVVLLKEEAEANRAQAAEAEVARLKALLAEKGISPPPADLPG
jgi:Uma2 family endonuclease